jgi:DNA polymerase zeta
MCAECAAEPATTAHTLLVREHVAHARLADLHRVCAACAGTPVADGVLCSSVDCPVTYARTAAEKDATEVGDVRALIQSLDW